MGNISTLINTPVLIDFPSDFSDSGWTIEGGKAVHKGCNAGYITNTGIKLELGKQYEISYVIESWTSGMVRAVLGTAWGSSFSSNGPKKEIIEATGNTNFQFYSDGNLTVSLLKIDEVLADEENGRTLIFNEDANKWLGEVSWKPDFMCKFIDGFFSFESGVLWEHNVNEIRNNFYNTQYKSKVVFYVNINHSQIKQFYTMRQDSNKPWDVTELYIYPVEGKQDGMRSYIPSGNFNNYQGQWFADILRNIDDPRFTNDLEALFHGSDMQGAVMRVSMENDAVTEIRLISVDVKCSPQNFTY